MRFCLFSFLAGNYRLAWADIRIGSSSCSSSLHSAWLPSRVSEFVLCCGHDDIGLFFLWLPLPSFFWNFFWDKIFQSAADKVAEAVHIHLGCYVNYIISSCWPQYPAAVNGTTSSIEIFRVIRQGFCFLSNKEFHCFFFKIEIAMPDMISFVLMPCTFLFRAVSSL